jgi:hypothetical protein
MSFGGKNWTIDPADFRLQKLSSTECLGAFFEIDTGSSAPAWIVGDTFLVRFLFLISPFLSLPHHHHHFPSPITIITTIPN